ncbi:substrate-binding domain-containing protein [Fusobacterium massiliense]|uniref:substrate-binding domain-containing protein n=1 Tax=Fusobacterium massiliense TaxID=1852365 RepID=UPI0028D88DB1|nr:substrate-binding domain-containing protein [Fusobacterium massiliense]
MKRKMIFIIAIFVFIVVGLLNSCRHKDKIVINVYAEDEIELLVEKYAKRYEKTFDKYKVEVNKLDNFKDYNIIITNEENKVKTLNKNVKTRVFFEDKLVIIGRKKINDLEELENFSLAMPELDTNIGKIGLSLLSDLKSQKKVLENATYKDNVISSLQSVDLYEVDFALVTRSILYLAKNSSVCYTFSGDSRNKVLYKSYLVTRKSKDAKKFYQFLDDEIKEKNKKA